MCSQTFHHKPSYLNFSSIVSVETVMDSRSRCRARFVSAGSLVASQCGRLSSFSISGEQWPRRSAQPICKV